MTRLIALVAVALPLAMGTALAAESGPAAGIETAAIAVSGKVIEWRRDFHQHPELGFQEVRTAKRVADHLSALGYEVRTGVGGTGIVGVLTGGKPGPVVALRADMDALPVAEEVDLPFASKATTQWMGKETPVMHACGHDAHVAILMGVAEILAGLRAELPGTVKLLFQPAEEGAPDGGPSGAFRMVADGALADPKPGAVFGLHVTSALPVGGLALRPGGAMAAADRLRIEVRGRGGHGAMPWNAVDPIVAAADVVTALQTVTSRQIDLTRSPAVVTIGSINGGNRGNVIPDGVTMEGTIRSFDEAIRTRLHERVRIAAENAARITGAEAKVEIFPGAPVLWNDPKLTEWSNVVLKRVAGAVVVPPPAMASEDFPVFTKDIPGVYFFIGVTPKGKDPQTAAPNHSPRFYVDESGLQLGVRALSQLAVEYLARTS